MQTKLEENFNPKEHICKFGYELYDYTMGEAFRYNILSDLYLKEIVFEFIGKRSDQIIERYGFSISPEKMETLLPLLKWNDFEKYRDLPDDWAWKYENGHAGYRDGWGYKFWCLSESGMPLIEIYMDCLFDKKHLPPYEKLLEWLRENYKDEKQLKKWNMLW